MWIRIAVCLALLAGLACGRSENSQTSQRPSSPPPVAAAPAPTALPARIGAIDLGRAIGPDGRVTAPGSTFAPSETIYVSVLTEGQPSGATLSARWTYEDGQLVSEGREILADGKTATEFHISKPDGWPAGRYRVDIALNGQPAGAREFEVR